MLLTVLKKAFVSRRSIVSMAKQKRLRKIYKMENLKKRLVNNEKPTHITHKIFGKNYAAIHEISQF